MLPVTITPNSINVLMDGRMRTVHKGHLNFRAISDTIKGLSRAENYDGEHEGLLDNLRAFLDIPLFVAKISEGRVKIGDNSVYFDGQEVKGVVTDRLLALLREGHDVRPLARFLDRVSKNPTLTARDEIYLWMESGNMPLTDDGCFLAFKKVGADYQSSHRNPDGSLFYNRIGTVCEMPRENVDTDRTNTCSTGLHFCSWQYLPEFGIGDTSRVVIVKVAPEDVVSIPIDYNHSKGRAWRYVVIGEVPESECRHLFDDKPVVSSFGLYDNSDDDLYDDLYDDDYDSSDDDDSSDACVDNCDDAACCCASVSGDDHDDDSVSSSETTFRRGQQSWTAQELKQLCADYGQRGVARITGIPRTTLQGWLERIG